MTTQEAPRYSTTAGLATGQLGPLTARAGGFLHTLPCPRLGGFHPQEPVDVLIPLRRGPVGLVRLAHVDAVLLAGAEDVAGLGGCHGVASAQVATRKG